MGADRKCLYLWCLFLWSDWFHLGSRPSYTVGYTAANCIKLQWKFAGFPPVDDFSFASVDLCETEPHVDFRIEQPFFFSSDGATAASPTKEPVAILFPSRTNLAAEIVAPYAIGVGRVSAEMTNVPTVGVASDFANGQRTEEREKPRVPSFEVLVVSEEKAVSIDLVSPLENAPAAPMERRPSVPIPTSVSLPPSAPIMAPLPLRPAWTGSLPLSIVGDRHSQTAFAHKLMEPPKLLHPSPLSVAQTNGSARPFVYKQESGSFRENRG